MKIVLFPLLAIAVDAQNASEPTSNTSDQYFSDTCPLILGLRTSVGTNAHGIRDLVSAGV